MGETLEPSTIVILTKIDMRLGTIEETTSRLDHSINGNDKPGLIEDHRTLQRLVEGHLGQAKLDIEARILLATETKAAKELLAAETKKALDGLAIAAEAKVAALATATAARKEKVSVRTWAVIMALLVAVLGVLGGQVAFYMQLLRTP